MIGALNKLLKRGSPPDESGLWLAAFGKHPGWQDHIEDLGVETSRLAALKQRLYVEGIGGNIDSGAWTKLPDDHRLPGFGHDVLQSAAGSVLLGRLWASRDGKGRDRYPMVVAMEARGTDIASTIREGLPLLAQLESDCIAATEAVGVKAAVDRARATVRAQGARWGSDAREPGDPFRALGSVAKTWSDGDAAMRVLYQAENDLRVFSGKTADTKSAVDLPGRHLRLPAAHDDAASDLRFWLMFLQRVVPDGTPVTLLRPHNGGWTDAIVGAVRKVTTFCLLADRQAVPPVSEIPYEIDSVFRDHARKLLGG